MSSPSTTHDQRRLFLALWPEDAERRQMAEMAASIAGRRRVRDAHLHLTLVFLGATDSAHLAAYEAALADVSVPILDLILDRYGYWPRPRILWLGCSRSSLELDNLVANLRQRLCGCGFTPERRPFQAHITLARNHPGPAPMQSPVAPVHWRIGEVALVESLREENGSCYRVLRRWPG
ncbi:RNA 2',3'-cyclic phosphodiesterase [Candidatus Contendibacter odensensis]|uniref:RNA 2',3'-cyclic phosphodiesterase n=1 Tax=Candidatus Contendobacter odensis Run_B_J11 TaxID=1400861 RepID=A0A7U7GFV1_9GAMM|nr:RNA 2',3'-cyclic phosphodiesterase [Candidatus Contendobacter odensis]CDH47641.1 putative 2'-5' RNA ligase [Candidatus Contendobacter odensis Run_B_J11]